AALLAPAVHDRLAADEAPDVSIEAAELLLHGEEAAGVRDRGLDLLPVADDAGIGEQPLDRAAVEARDARRVEIGERAPVAVALAENRPPREARLRGFEHEELEVLPVVVHRDAPLLVVVALVRGIDVQAPRAADQGSRHDA